MVAIISELWETGIQIITSANGDGISSFAELKKHNNVLVGKKEKGVPSYMPTEVMIDDEIIYISITRFNHPEGGKITVCEIQ